MIVGTIKYAIVRMTDGRPEYIRMARGLPVIATDPRDAATYDTREEAEQVLRTVPGNGWTVEKYKWMVV